MRYTNKQMRTKRPFAAVALLAVSLYAVLSLPAVLVRAQFSGSTYKIEEAQVGATGSDNELTSTQYQARATAGDTAVGIVNGTTYQAIGGFTTSDTPELEVIASLLNLDLGNASTSTALTGTSVFGVRSYLAQGYVVIIRGAAPTQESNYTMSALASQTISTVGTEQFGINLALNTTGCATPAPANYGAAPAQVPDSSFSFGIANINYDDCGQYRYVDGDTIAQSSSSSGVTNYTISYLVNINTITRAGTYNFPHSVNVVSTF